MSLTQFLRLNAHSHQSVILSGEEENKIIMENKKFLFGVFRLIDVCWSAVCKWVKCQSGVPVFRKSSSVYNPWPHLTGVIIITPQKVLGFNPRHALLMLCRLSSFLPQSKNKQTRNCQWPDRKGTGLLSQAFWVWAKSWARGAEVQ